MIGLKRGSVSLVPYDPMWQEMGEDICRKLKEACADLTTHVEHVGSTSVPGLSAKPIVDIVIGLPAIELIAELKDRLVTLGYVYRGVVKEGVDHLFGMEPEPEIRTVNVHAVVYGSADWGEYVSFRDLLRQDPELLRSYDELKRQNASKFAGNRRAYTAAKHEFVNRILRARSDVYRDEI